MGFFCQQLEIYLTKTGKQLLDTAKETGPDAAHTVF